MTREQRKAHLLEGAAVVAIVLLAAVLRMGWPGLTEFKADEARLLSLALEMRGGAFAVRGISSSTGFPNFPMSVWLYAIPTLIWPHVYAATLFTSLLNTLAVVGCYWMVRRYWGVQAALVAALMFAVSPWAIIFSRKIWAQNLLPLMVMVWAISAGLAFTEGRRWFLVLHIVSLAVAIQTHLAAIALAPATLIFLIAFHRRVDWRLVMLGGAISLFVAAPFLVYLAPRLGSGPSLLRSGEGQAATGLSAAAVRYAGMITMGSDIHSLAGPQQFETYLAQLPPMQPVYWLWSALVVGGLIWLVVGVVRQRETIQSQVGFILVVWLIVPLAVFLWQWTPVYLHYFIAMLPAPYMIAGVGFSALLNRLRRWFRGAVWAAFLLSAGLQVYAWLSLLTLLGSVATPAGFGTPVAVKLGAADRAREQIAAGATEVLIVGVGASPKVDSFPAEYDALLFDVPRRFVDVTSEALFPAAQSVVIVDDRTEVPAGATSDLYRAAASGAEVIPAREGEGGLMVLSLPAGAAPAAQAPLEPPILLANWVTLLGSDGLRATEGLGTVWQIHWRTGDNPDPATYHFFNHLLDGRDQRLAQVDAPAFIGSQWQPGDIVVSRFLIPWPAAGEPRPAKMRVGMYRFPELTAVPLLDEAANPYADTLEIPLE